MKIALIIIAHKIVSLLLLGLAYVILRRSFRTWYQ
jgi:hypothetical protein